MDNIPVSIGVTMTNEDVFMATSFGDFKAALVGLSRGAGGKTEFVLKDPVNMHVNKMDISFAKQVRSHAPSDLLNRTINVFLTKSCVSFTAVY